MSTKPDRWIEIPGWEKFQHYKDRDPPWIKNHTRLLHKDAYLELTPAARGILHGLWMMRSQAGGPVRESHAKRLLGAPLGANEGTTRAHTRRFREHLESLNHAGFIQFLASKPLAQETETETETEQAGKGTTGPPPLEPPSLPANIDNLETPGPLAGSILAELGRLGQAA